MTTSPAGSTRAISPESAAEALADIEIVAARVRQSRSYRIASSALILWGPLVALGYLITQFMPAYAKIAWMVCHASGLLLTGLLAVHERRTHHRPFDLRVVWALLVVIGFGLLWSVGIMRLGPREMSAFWPTLFMMGYILAGLWLGRLFVLLGSSITLFCLAGYLWSGPWFDLYMAIVNGGGLLLCGLAMRRA